MSPNRDPSFREARQETRYTVGQLLTWTTFIAIATMVGTWADLTPFNRVRVDHFLVATALMPLVRVATCWLLPWGGAIGVTFLTATLVVPVTLELFQVNDSIGPIGGSIALNLVQAIVLIPWLSVWRITARRQAAGRKEPTSAEA